MVRGGGDRIRLAGRVRFKVRVIVRMVDFVFQFGPSR